MDNGYRSKLQKYAAAEPSSIISHYMEFVQRLSVLRFSEYFADRKTAKSKSVKKRDKQGEKIRPSSGVRSAVQPLKKDETEGIGLRAQRNTLFVRFQGLSWAGPIFRLSRLLSRAVCHFGRPDPLKLHPVPLPARFDRRLLPAGRRVCALMLT